MCGCGVGVMFGAPEPLPTYPPTYTCIHLAIPDTERAAPRLDHIQDLVNEPGVKHVADELERGMRGEGTAVHARVQPLLAFALLCCGGSMGRVGDVNGWIIYVYRHVQTHH